MKRRQFMHTAFAGVTGIALGSLSNISVEASETMLKIEYPFHGAVLNRRHGKDVDGGLQIEVSGEAPVRDYVEINGVPARRIDHGFAADIILRETETDIVAVSKGIYGNCEHRVRVVWDKYSEPRYRFSIDDNSYFLRDIAQKNYASLFDCFYLKILKDLHTKYGARFVLNIYYTTEDGFEISHVPDRYKGEWEENSDWLKLAFHAYANDPDRPYQHTSAEKIISDWDKVAEQIHRFAGEQTYSPPTVIHWAMVQPETLKPLYDHGIRVLSGYFCRGNGGWDINYFMDDIRSEYLSRHDALRDFDSGIVFSKIDIVCNGAPVEEIIPTLEPLSKDPNRAEIMDLFTHEQYFWPFYKVYLPDHAERLDTAIRWVTEQGYKPVFFHEGFMGGRI